jgi:hypothetical protein
MMMTIDACASTVPRAAFPAVGLTVRLSAA